MFFIENSKDGKCSQYSIGVILIRIGKAEGITKIVNRIGVSQNDLG